MDLEKEEIAINLAGEQFSKRTNTDCRNNESEFLNYLQDKTQNDTINIADAALQLNDSDKLDSIAAQFSRYRVKSLQSYVQSRNDSSIISVRNYHADAPMNVGSAPFFKIEYAIIEEEAD